MNEFDALHRRGYHLSRWSPHVSQVHVSRLVPAYEPAGCSNFLGKAGAMRNSPSEKFPTSPENFEGRAL